MAKYNKRKFDFDFVFGIIIIFLNPAHSVLICYLVMYKTTNIG